MLSFARNYLAAKGANAEAGVMVTLAKWDPKGVGDAGIRQREEYLDKLGRELISLRNKFNDEAKAFALQQTAFNTRVAAAQDIQSRLDATTDPAEHSRIDASLQNLLRTLESMRPEAEQAKTDHDSTAQWLAEREEAYKQAVLQVKQARSDFDNAQKDLARATDRKRREEDMAEQARASAGLAPQGNQFNAALDALRSAARKASEDADAAKLKRESLSATSDTEDPLIAEAIARASGQATAPKTSAERLAALGKI